jgi:hypothetical protein
MDKNAKSNQTHSKNQGLAIPRKALILLLVSGFVGLALYTRANCAAVKEYLGALRLLSLSLLASKLYSHQ